MKIDCTEVNGASNGSLIIECPCCGKLFNALPSAFTVENYICPFCLTKIIVKLVAILE